MEITRIKEKKSLHTFKDSTKDIKPSNGDNVAEINAYFEQQ